MKVKFTKASKNDGTLVTLSLAQFENNNEGCVVHWLPRESMIVGDTVCVVLDGNQVSFTVNRVRDGKAVTATTHCFPRYMRLPQVGRPVYAEVSETF